MRAQALLRDPGKASGWPSFGLSHVMVLPCVYAHVPTFLILDKLHVTKCIGSEVLASSSRPCVSPARGVPWAFPVRDCRWLQDIITPQSWGSALSPAD